MQDPLTAGAPGNLLAAQSSGQSTDASSAGGSPSDPASGGSTPDPTSGSPTPGYPIALGRRLWLERGGRPVIGAGILELLSLVPSSGSLHRAAREMGRAYSKAWLIVRRAENELGFPLLERRTGGSGGGGSILSPEGRRLIEVFGALVEEADRTLDELGERYLGTWPLGGEAAARGPAVAASRVGAGE